MWGHIPAWRFLFPVEGEAMRLGDRVINLLTGGQWDAIRRNFISGADADEKLSAIDTSGNNALKYNVIFASNRVLGETMASIPIAEFKKVDDKTREKTDDTGLYDILHASPNDEMSSFNFHEMAVSQINFGGNLVAKVQKTRLGEILGLYPYEWQKVQFDREKEGSRRLQYVVENGTTEKKIMYRTGTDGKPDIFHVPGPSMNGVVGMSAIQYAAGSIRLGMTYEQLGNNMFKNGTFPSGIFSHPKTLNKDAYDRLKSDLEAKYGGIMNNGKPILAEDGLTFTPIKISLVDAAIIESRTFQVQDAVRSLRVPLHLIQELSRSTNNNIEHQSLEFTMYTMLPWCKRFEQCINCQLLTKDQRKAGYYFEYNISALLRGDSKSMAEAFAIGRQGGWLSVNDIRRLLNMNPIPNGDIYLQPSNMIEAGSVLDGGAAINQKILDDIKLLMDSRK